MLSGIFENKPIYNKFLIVIGIVLFCTGVFTIFGAFLAKIFYNVDVMADPEVLNQLDDPVVLSALKLLQILSTGFGMFIVPAFIIAYLFSRNPFEFLDLKRSIGPLQLILTVVLLMVSVPFINVLINLNQQMVLPDFMSGIEQWIRQSEESAMQITEAFLVMNTTGDLILNLFVMAVLPAIGEELIFRGVLQKIFKELTGNLHVAVVLAAFVFSAFHMQFYGFIPRFALGLAFGYLLIWSGSMWVPILAHFVNNAAAVILTWFAGNGDLPFDQDTIGTNQGEWKLVVVSMILIVLTTLLLKKTFQRTELE